MKRVVHLALSPKAATVLMKMIEAMDGYMESEEEATIADAIHADIKAHFEDEDGPKRKKKK